LAHFTIQGIWGHGEERLVLSENSEPVRQGCKEWQDPSTADEQGEKKTLNG